MFRYYQDDAIDGTEFSWCELPRVSGCLGTGGGKTVIAAGLVGRSEGMKVAFLADQDELCEQPLRAIRRFAGVIPALDKGRKHVASLSADCVVASSQTWLNEARLTRYPRNHFQRIIIDECHRGTERDMRFIDAHFPDAQVLGLTATPFRKNLRDLTRWFPAQAFSMPMLDLIQAGFAPFIKPMCLPVEINLSAVGTSMMAGEKDYKLADLDTTIAPYYRAIARAAKPLFEGRHTIAFLPLVKSSIDFVSILRSEGISAGHVDGTTKNRSEVIEAFAQGRFSVLCNSDVLSTGVDIPIADTLLDMSPTSSLNKYWQRIGRTMRVLPDVIDDLPGKDQADARRARIAESAKPYTLVIEVIYQGDRLNSIHAGHLVARDEEEARAIYERIKKDRSPEELLEIARRVQAEKEERLVEAIEQATARAHAYDPAQVGYLLSSPKIRDYDVVSGWEIAAPSSSQLSLLERLGVNVASIQFKGLASRMIDELIFRKKHGYADLAQVSVLRAAGVPNPERLTRREAIVLIEEKSLERGKEVREASLV